MISTLTYEYKVHDIAKWYICAIHFLSYFAYHFLTLWKYSIVWLTYGKLDSVSFLGGGLGIHSVFEM
jgi:hypothetical protein